MQSEDFHTGQKSNYKVLKKDLEYSVYLYITTQMVLTFRINPPFYPHVSRTVSCPYTFTYIKYILKRKY